MELTIEPTALADLFLNRPAESFTLAINWPAADEVLFDDTPPRVEQVLVRGGFVEIELSEEADLSAVPAAVTITGQSPTWDLSDDHYTLRTDAPLAPSNCQLTIGTDSLDLAGLGLVETFTASLRSQHRSARLCRSQPADHADFRHQQLLRLPGPYG